MAGKSILIYGASGLGKGTIIGAGAVVIEDIPDNVTAVGVPAKVIAKR